MFQKQSIKINYISELNLPSYSAYSIHVMKMCEAFSKLGYETDLYVINNSNSVNLNKNYNIKYQFNIISVFEKSYKLNFILRIIFLLKILLKNLSSKEVIITRSILYGIFSCVFNKNIFLELHHEITGLSKYIYKIFNFLKLTKKLNYIFLHKKLNDLYKINKKKFIVLDDAADIDNFKIKNTKKFKNTCVYIGSFFEGKGLEQIIRLAKRNNKINFHLYGQITQIKTKPKLSNIRFFGYVNYSSVPKILSNYEIALMPYQKKVRGRSSIWLEQYMSPLKMFDYMAAGLIIVASDLPVYKHLMRNNYNCKLLTLNNDSKWSTTINQIFRNKDKYTYLKRNAINTAKKFTWEKRAKKIINFYISKNE